jgi:hypothetical protein
MIKVVSTQLPTSNYISRDGRSLLMAVPHQLGERLAAKSSLAIFCQIQIIQDLCIWSVYIYILLIYVICVCSEFTRSTQLNTSSAQGAKRGRYNQIPANNPNDSIYDWGMWLTQYMLVSTWVQSAGTKLLFASLRRWPKWHEAWSDPKVSRPM